MGLRELEIVALRLLQEDFPVCPRPFLELACRANRGICRPRTVYFEVVGPGSERRPVVARHKCKPVSEKDLLTAASGLARRGYLRKVSGVFGPRLDSSPGSLPWKIAKELEGGLPLVPEPYRELARKLAVSEEELLDNIKALQEAGYLRRLGAILGLPARRTQERSR